MKAGIKDKFPNNYSIAEVRIMRSLNKHFINRQTADILSFCSNVGGFAGVLFSFGHYLTIFLAKF